MSNMTISKPGLSQRQYYFDYLRVFASLAIMLIHVTAQNMRFVEVAGTEWCLYNLCQSLSRWGVPVFVMISGSLFLQKEIDLKTLYRKYILRMVIAYVVWSAFYAIAMPIGKLIFEDGYKVNSSEIINKFIEGPVHLWFIPMIIGLYVCIPFIKAFIKNSSVTKYFLLLSFVFLFLKNEINLISENFFSGYFAEIKTSLDTLIYNFNLHFILGYIPYFILGYYLNKTDFTKKSRLIIYLLGIMGLVMTFTLNLFAAKSTNQSTEAFYGAGTVNILLMSSAIFVWFKYNIKGKDALNKFIIKLSKYSFGAYLVHIFILLVLTTIGIQTTSFHPLLSIPVITFIDAIASYLISFILNQIPIIKKYIV